MFDVIVRGGLVVDGSGQPGFQGDVAVKDGRIAAVGRVEGEARQVVDAAGRVVAPGFIDPHTHFDVQLLWDGAARPALEHGVTCVVPGNCSLSLAPLKAADRPRVVGMFQQIEEMPPEAFTTAFDWTWEDFAGYRAAIEKALSINVAPLVGHSVIRLWVMGPAAQERAATPDEIAAMQDLLRQCLDAGAVGLSTSFVDIDENGRPVPSRFAQFEELDALAAVLGEYGRMLQCVPEFYATDITIARIDQFAELSLKHNIPTTFSPLFDTSAVPDNAPRAIARVEEQFARGARVWPQMQTRPIDISFSLLRPSLFFARLPRWVRVLRLPLEARLAALRDPDTVAKLVADTGPDGGEAMMGRLILRGGDAAPAELAGKTLSEIAKARGQVPAQALIDLSLEHGLDVAFLSASQGHQSTDRIGPMLAHPLVHIGASDGGAHIASFSTYGDTGYLFSEFVRKGRHLSLEQAVAKITGETADIWGLKDRGRLQPGLAADIVVFDAETIDREAELPTFDMPGDGMRYVRAARGIDTVLVNGEVAYANGAYTEARAGVVCV
ncbi:MAG: amidohydrolase [Phenylobacterium sp. RIFCSPHIGHO2_01_FULL_69_31]|uniref:N-acyl-D-amino-acid deacylase family protein n=1 Tax=Phenylobacterium sp. RIFCSPHIGHO2_01_FULL_69_31 TaxID=1801944 RepID=UPI0008ACAA41|nr:amidohydrolase family protein [Phenylobacterium sp. RIFCSPHIGHO2_01_FULL_69_31]OHB31756.1 MAG: amidohydrolase [Phenylobacterium sp. RIFCSPHIGHO2_01_FULL_69_31]